MKWTRVIFPLSCHVGVTSLKRIVKNVPGKVEDCGLTYLSGYVSCDMKVFHCDHCGHLLFFENTECVNCRHRVAYLPDLQVVGSLDQDGTDNWRSPLARRRRADIGCVRTTQMNPFATGRWPPPTIAPYVCRAGSRELSQILAIRPTAPHGTASRSPSGGCFSRSSTRCAHLESVGRSGAGSGVRVSG